MKLAIHQPNYLPWPGYFHKMESVDLFLILDTVQYMKHEYDNRCKIKTPEGEQWLTVPVSSPNLGTPINKVMLAMDADIWRYNWKPLKNNYSKSPFFEEYKDELHEIYGKKWDRLIDLNLKLIETVQNWLGIKTRLKFASELPETTLKGTELILSHCRELKADEYLSGMGGKNYLEQEQFDNDNIRLEFQNYTPIVYPQRFGDFVPNLSVIDLLFNCGKDSLSRIMGNYRNE
ncbi:MAG: WbqC family protein [Candidatus Marinimicrobia bacterium]|nr:WbqC family protein [Candidatus Neomarinimicrobiota bacterium]